MKIVDYISQERLATFDSFTDTQDRAIVLHNHTLQLGSSLMSMIALFELALRNSTNHQLITDYGDDNWLLPVSATIPLKPFEVKAQKTAVRHARKAAYSKFSYKEKTYLDAFAYPGGVPATASHDEKARERQKLFVVSHGQVISQTTFSFWKRLYSGDYAGTLWKKSLKKVFPNKDIERADVAKALEVIYATRNRVAHHEPVYGVRLDEAMEAIKFLRDTLGAKRAENPSEFQKFSRIQYLRLRMDYESFQEVWNTLT